MYLISVLSISCVVLSVTCAPQRYWSSDESEESPGSYWLTPRRPSYQPYPQYGSFSDEMTRMLDELQKSILSARVAPQFPSRGQFPVLAVSTSTGEDDDSDGGTSVSISGTGFGSLFNNFGGFDTKNLKNKTTVKTEVIDGHKVTVKESTYVSDNDGFKSVIHLSEVDLGDSTETDSDKPKESTPKSTEEESVENNDDKEKEDKPKEVTSTSGDVEEDKTEDQTPKNVPEVETKSTTEEPSSKNDEDTSDSKNSEENSIKSNRNPDSEVEEIDTNGDNSYNFYNTVDRIKVKEVGKLKSA